MNEEEACVQNQTDDGIIEFGPDTDTGTCVDESRIYKWQVNTSDNGGHDVNVIICFLSLDENAGNYLIISPGK